MQLVSLFSHSAFLGAQFVNLQLEDLWFLVIIVVHNYFLQYLYFIATFQLIPLDAVSIV